LVAAFAGFSAVVPASFSLFLAAGFVAAFATVAGLAVLAGFTSSASGVIAGVAFTVSFGDGVTKLLLTFLRRRTPKDPFIIFPLFDFLSPLPIFFEIFNC